MSSSDVERRAANTISWPMDEARELAARDEVATLSNDAVVYMLHLSLLAVAQSLPEEMAKLRPPLHIYAYWANAMVGEIPDKSIPDVYRLHAKEIAEKMFSMMPKVPH